MIIEIKGVEFNNKGAELMLLSIIAALDERVKDYELVLSPGYLLPYLKRAKLGAYQKFGFKFLGVHWEWLGNLAPASVKRLLRHFGVVVEKDIDVVLDASGFVYSDQWNGPKLKQTFKHLKRIAKYNTRYIFLPQAFGPFEKVETRRLMQTLLSRATLILARDTQSYSSLNSIVISNKIKLFPDFTTLLAVENVTLPLSLPKKYACVIPNSKMYYGKDVEFKNEYLDYMAEVIDTIDSMGLSVILINHEGEKDHNVCVEIVARSRVEPMYFPELSALEIKKTIGQAQFCVSSRYHACVNGLSQGVPTLSTSWSHKYEELYRYYECPEYVVDLTGGKTLLMERLAKVMEAREALTAKLLIKAAEHRRATQEMWAQVCNEFPS